MHAKPLKTIVAGYDGSEQAGDGLALARVLATLLDAEVVALSVLTYAPTEATWAVYERLQREEEERMVREARAGLAGVGAVETVVSCGPSPARALDQLAESRGADLLVLGSTHRGPVGRVLPGTVADRLMAGAPCPLAIAPRGYAETEPELGSIGVAYDGSPEARHALALAVAIASAAGASLELIAVADPSDPVEAGGPEGWAALVATQEGIDRGRRRMWEEVESAAESLPEGLDVTVDVVDGDPRPALVELSERVDLLAIGSRGYGPLGRVLLGGVSSALVREAACPVVVTPRSSAPAG